LLYAFIKKIVRRKKNKITICLEDINHEKLHGTNFYIKSPIRVVVDQELLGNNVFYYLDQFPPESIYYKKIQSFKESRKRMDISYFY